jgi:hypothetical protein
MIAEAAIIRMHRKIIMKASAHNAIRRSAGVQIYLTTMDKVIAFHAIQAMHLITIIQVNVRTAITLPMAGRMQASTTQGSTIVYPAIRTINPVDIILDSAQTAIRQAGDGATHILTTAD